jgi:hypothetical protein
MSPPINAPIEPPTITSVNFEENIFNRIDEEIYKLKDTSNKRENSNIS